MTQRATEGIRAACLKNERKAQAGLKKLKLGNTTYLKHVNDLTFDDAPVRIATEKQQLVWLKRWLGK